MGSKNRRAKAQPPENDAFGLFVRRMGRIKAGKLQYRHNTLYGNPCLKLLRHEVEALVNTKYGSDYLQTKNSKTALNKVDTEIRNLKRKIAQLEKRKEALLAMLHA
jgi:hypothetical protein